jgi:preprotein translocase SecE subunit
VAYKSDQGRYVRMASFWGLTLFWAFGCYSLSFALQAWFEGWFGAGEADLGRTRLFHVPFLFDFSLAKILALAAFAAGVWFMKRLLDKPKSADLLIETEAELRKVTWPTIGDTYAASLVVIITVLILVFFLMFADKALLYLAGRAIGFDRS